MDEILHHLQIMGNQWFLQGESSFQGLLGGAGFRSSTVCPGSSRAIHDPRTSIFAITAAYLEVQNGWMLVQPLECWESCGWGPGPFCQWNLYFCHLGGSSLKTNQKRVQYPQERHTRFLQCQLGIPRKVTDAGCEGFEMVYGLWLGLTIEGSNGLTVKGLAMCPKGCFMTMEGCLREFLSSSCHPRAVLHTPPERLGIPI